MLKNYFNYIRYLQFMLLVILLILLGVQHGRAQTVTPAIVNSTGNTYAQSDITYEWRWWNLENIKTIADQSSLPHSQVKFIISAIDSLQKDISKNARLDSVVNRK
jgi:hypothetical protein